MFFRQDVSAEEIKLSVMLYSSYHLKCSVVVDEISLFSSARSDVIAAKPTGYIHEFEVKTSIADLKADGRKKRWDIMKAVSKRSLGSDGKCPNYFFFAVPFSMRKEALKVIKEKYPFAGLILCNAPEHFSYNKIIKRGTRLHNYPVATMKREKIYASLSRRYLHAYKRGLN